MKKLRSLILVFFIALGAYGLIGCSSSSYRPFSPILHKEAHIKKMRTTHTQSSTSANSKANKNQHMAMTSAIPKAVTGHAKHMNDKHKKSGETFFKEPIVANTNKKQENGSKSTNKLVDSSKPKAELKAKLKPKAKLKAKAKFEPGLESKNSSILSTKNLAVDFYNHNKLRGEYNQKAEMYLQKGRRLLSLYHNPLPAEGFIRLAISYYGKSGNKLGIARAYQLYGMFLVSPMLRAWKNYYSNNGFMDAHVSYYTRYDRGLEYLTKAENIFKKQKRKSDLIGIYYDKGLAYVGMHPHLVGKACTSFDASQYAYNAYKLQHYNYNPAVPRNYKNYGSYIAYIEWRVGCLSTSK